jgi:branched-chain amino acid aminotransferase
VLDHLTSAADGERKQNEASRRYGNFGTGGEQAEELVTEEVGERAAAGAGRWPAGAAWIDGRYCPVQEAKISVLDLGVTRSDCTYDVVHVWRGRFYRLDAHLDRFSASMARLRLDPGHGRAEIEAIVHGCVRRAGLRDAYVSMTCTRGRTVAGSRDLRTARNTFYCFAIPFVWISPPDQQAGGTSLWISEMTRIPPQSVDPSVKNYHWLDLDMALLDAYDHDAQLVVLRDLAGAITEGPGFNIFANVDGRWLTPAAGTLEGITRRSVIELASEAGQPLQQGQLTADDLRRAAEVLITSTAGGIMPVTVIDGKPIGTGTPGPLTAQLRDRYWARHQDPQYSTPVRYSEQH